MGIFHGSMKLSSLKLYGRSHSHVIFLALKYHIIYR